MTLPEAAGEAAEAAAAAAGNAAEANESHMVSAAAAIGEVMTKGEAGQLAASHEDTKELIDVTMDPGVCLLVCDASLGCISSPCCWQCYTQAVMPLRTYTFFLHWVFLVPRRVQMLDSIASDALHYRTLASWQLQLAPICLVLPVAYSVASQVTTVLPSYHCVTKILLFLPSRHYVSILPFYLCVTKSA